MVPVAEMSVDTGETSSSLIPKTSAVIKTEDPTATAEMSNATMSTVTWDVAAAVWDWCMTRKNAIIPEWKKICGYEIQLDHQIQKYNQFYRLYNDECQN